MPFSKLLIRVDGVLTDLEPIRFMAYQKVFEEAGFKWTCSKEEFVEAGVQADERVRLAGFVLKQVRGRKDTEDIQKLIAAMHRRQRKHFYNFLRMETLHARPGSSDLLCAAEQEGILLGFVSTLSAADHAYVMNELFPHNFHAIPDRCVATCDDLDREEGNTSPEVQLYAAVKDKISVPPENCLVLEATLRGALAAETLEFPTQFIGVRPSRSDIDCRSTQTNFHYISDIIQRDRRHRYDPMTPEQRSQLIASLHKIHCGGALYSSRQNGVDSMRVSTLLDRKKTSRTIQSIDSTATLRSLSKLFDSAGVGAAVVRDRNGGLTGIISERDLARGLAIHGSDLANMTVGDLMTRRVFTCAPEDSLAAVARIMTDQRVRHVPVVSGGNLIGVVSIGDVLKYRLDEVELEADVLRDFAMSRG